MIKFFFKILELLGDRLEVCVSVCVWQLYSNIEKVQKNGHSKKDKTKILMTNGSLMKVESIAECSPWNILQYF